MKACPRFSKFFRLCPAAAAGLLLSAAGGRVFAAEFEPAAKLPPLIAPVLKLKSGEQDIKATQGGQTPPAVALSFDLCMGQTDRRIFDVLVRKNIPAALFVTKRWLSNKANAPIIAEIKARPDLFEIGNHGANHIPPVDDRPAVYGLKTAGNLRAVCAEAEGGLAAIKAAGLSGQMSGKFWYRGAAALYSPNALRLLRRAGFSIAGFSVNGDEGAELSAEKAYARITAARNGDVVIAHMNQPRRPAGAGVAAAIETLRARGYRFAKLGQAAETETAPHLSRAEEGLFLRGQDRGRDAAPGLSCAALIGETPAKSAP